jgi:hypothetical protein
MYAQRHRSGSSPLHQTSRMTTFDGNLNVNGILNPKDEFSEGSR